MIESSSLLKIGCLIPSSRGIKLEILDGGLLEEGGEGEGGMKRLL